MAPPIKGRGALSNRRSRYLSTGHEPEPGAGAVCLEEEALPERHPATTVRIDPARSIVSRNDSPDVPFRQSINPYRGCEHGCIYCYARPSHAWLEHSPGLDFETILYAKPNAAVLLEAELTRPGYRPDVIHLGANTDPYQPIERDLKITRSILATLLRFRHPVTVLTKSALIERDLDLLGELARLKLVRAFVSITTLDRELKRTLEPRAASAAARLRAVAALAAAGVPTGVMVAPVIPAVTDHEIEEILEAAAAAGARRAGWILLRLPLEVRELFTEWLTAHRPLAAGRVMSLVRSTRDGADSDARFGHRMRGSGAYAELLARRFTTAARRLGFEQGDPEPLDLAQFNPTGAGGQLALW
ncbi:MAG TPA: PA0069 family radical SAM protein [Steroidobacteraceae bacterium]|nr:PA0069 family radical SAM protein [Steroidobacteraceae bacterium]